MLFCIQDYPLTYMIFLRNPIYNGSRHCSRMSHYSPFHTGCCRFLQISDSFHFGLRRHLNIVADTRRTRVSRQPCGHSLVLQHIGSAFEGCNTLAYRNGKMFHIEFRSGNPLAEILLNYRVGKGRLTGLLPGPCRSCSGSSARASCARGKSLRHCASCHSGQDRASDQNIPHSCRA